MNTNTPKTVLSDEQIDEIAAELTWYDGDTERLDHRGFARAIESAVLASSEGAAGATLESALAECRDAFPDPAPGDPLEQAWACAMGDPYSVPAYVRAALSASSTPAAVQEGAAKPVAWMYKDLAGKVGFSRTQQDADEARRYHCEVAPLYTHPTSGSQRIKELETALRDLRREVRKVNDILLPDSFNAQAVRDAEAALSKKDPK